MENSTLGMLTPFSIYKYVELNTGRTFDEYQNGFIPVYINDLKFKLELLFLLLLVQLELLIFQFLSKNNFIFLHS